MPPDRERLEDGEKLFVVCVVVELSIIEGAGMKSDRVNFAICCYKREDRGYSVIRSVGFDDGL